MAVENSRKNCGGDQLEYERCLCLHFPAEAALQSIECSSFEPIYWYHPDYLGHTDFVTDRTGQPYQHFFYAPFGEALLSQHTGTGYYNTPYRFNAKELDSETGLIYYGARYYEPKESVWMSVDPLAHKYPGLSGYNFVANNPIMLVDPDGRAPQVVVGDPPRRVIAIFYHGGLEGGGGANNSSKSRIHWPDL